LVNKNVLSCLLKDGREVDAVMLVGRLFHACAIVTGRVLCMQTTTCVVSDVWLRWQQPISSVYAARIASAFHNTERTSCEFTFTVDNSIKCSCVRPTESAHSPSFQRQTLPLNYLLGRIAPSNSGLLLHTV